MVLLLFAAALTGASVAGALASWFFGQFAQSASLAQTRAAIITKGKALEHLRAGRPSDAERLLTTTLDGDLMQAYYLVQDGWDLGKPTLERIAKEKGARAVSGYSPSEPEIRTVVEAALNIEGPGAK